MKSPLVFRRAARAEFDAAADWYEGRSVGRGVAFTAAVGRVLADIQARPMAHPLVADDVREALVARYPYAIYYRPGPDQITVLAVFHTARDPDGWRGRA